MDCKQLMKDDGTVFVRYDDNLYIVTSVCPQCGSVEDCLALGKPIETCKKDGSIILWIEKKRTGDAFYKRENAEWSMEGVVLKEKIV